MKNRGKINKQSVPKVKFIKRKGYDRRSVERKHQPEEEALIRKIAEEYTIEQGKKIEEEIQRVNNYEREEYEDKITVSLQDILKAAKADENHKSKRKVLPVFYKVAAVAAVLLLVVDISIVAVPAFRDSVLRFFEKSARTHTRIEAPSGEDDEILDDNDRMDIGLKEEYGISYLPEGYKVVSEKRDVVSLNIIYENANNNTILFKQRVDNDIINSDTEDATTYHKMVSGKDILFSVKGEKRMAFWRVEGYFLCMVSDNVSENEFIKVIESVKKE